jgi:thymidylate synthase ThyX
MEITAKVLLKTQNVFTGDVATTFELEYPRFIHSEFMTHRMFSRNAASSRAIPVAKTIEMVRSDPAMPVHWGKNQPGMQADEELQEMEKYAVQNNWLSAALLASDRAESMVDWGAHKQIVNRILEPYVWMKVVVTATEWNNFWWLRDHKDAQPEIRQLAKVMHRAYNEAKPITLYDGEWHLPYLDLVRGTGMNRKLNYCLDMEVLTTEDAKMVSASLCAQVSYRKLDFSVEKAKAIFDRLINSEPVHASPVEHQLLVRNPKQYTIPVAKDQGWTHMDFDGNYWSGNMKGYIQYRQLIPNHVKRG